VRSSPTAALVLVAAVIGGGAVLLTAKAAGLFHGTTVTEVVTLPAPTGDASAPVVVAKPLAGNGFEPAQIYRHRAAGVVTVYASFPGGSGGQGSGFVVSPAGSILTSAHVVTTAGLENGGSINPARQVYVEFADGDRAPATIVGYDVFDDVAVLHVDPKLHALAPVPLGDSSRVVVGEPVAAIGSPFGDAGSLSVGVVSAIRRTIPSITKYDLYDAIQTDAPINHGNSGGPLLDARGRVIGINAQITSSGGAGSGSEGVGFAVPIDAAKRSLAQLLATGKVAYAYVGINTEDLTPSLARHLGLAATRGALISEVVSGSGADRAGLKAGTHIEPFEGLGVPVGGDTIVAIDGIPVRSAEDVVRIVASRLLPGQTTRFTVVRGKAQRTVDVELGARRPPG
jgi:S1-C subfamily serine protease